MRTNLFLFCLKTLPIIKDILIFYHSPAKTFFIGCPK